MQGHVPLLTATVASCVMLTSEKKRKFTSLDVKKRASRPEACLPRVEGSVGRAGSRRLAGSQSRTGQEVAAALVSSIALYPQTTLVPDQSCQHQWFSAPWGYAGD